MAALVSPTTVDDTPEVDGSEAEAAAESLPPAVSKLGVKLWSGAGVDTSATRAATVVTAPPDTASVTGALASVTAPPDTASVTGAVASVTAAGVWAAPEVASVTKTPVLSVTSGPGTLLVNSDNVEAR